MARTQNSLKSTPKSMSPGKNAAAKKDTLRKAALNEKKTAVAKDPIAQSGARPDRAKINLQKRSEAAFERNQVKKREDRNRAPEELISEEDGDAGSQ